MKIVHIVSTDRGGAYRAAARISDSLNIVGQDSSLFILEKRKQDSAAKMLPLHGLKRNIFKVIRYMNAKRLMKYGLSSYMYEANIGFDLLKYEHVKSADVINLHWVNDGMLSYEGIKTLFRSGKKIIWTMHDMYSFTAGCYYDQECGQYECGCRICPFAGGIERKQAFINSMYRRKENAYMGGSCEFVGCSSWISYCASKSTLCKSFNIRTIHNPIDTRIFQPIEKEAARKNLEIRIAENKKIILFGAMAATSSKRKGYVELVEALQYIENKDDYCLVVFGNSKEEKIPVNIQCIWIGDILKDSELAALYSLADVFVAPSKQENLSNAVLEALACETPVVAFDIGGMSDMIIHGETGYLAAPFDTKELSKYIVKCKKEELGCKCRDFVENNFAMDLIGRQYVELYASGVEG